MKRFFVAGIILLAASISPSLAQYTLTFSDPIDQTCNWTVDKTATPTSADLWKGDSQEVQWEVDVTFDSLNFTVAGNLTVNSGSTNRNNKNLYICLRKNGVDEGACLNPTWVNLGSGNSYQNIYPYSFPGDYIRGSDTWTVFAEIRASNNTTVEQTQSHGLNQYMEACEVDVSDDRSGANDWVATESGGNWTYEETFSCNTDEGTIVNVATVETETDTARFALDCNDLIVNKTVDASFDREYDWTITKVGDQTEALLNTVTQSIDVNYDVEVDTTGHSDTAFLIQGMIEIVNQAAVSAEIAGVKDTLDGVLEAVVMCDDGGPVSFPYTLAADDTLNCTYSVSPSDASNTQNKATAQLQNYDVDYSGSATMADTTNFEDSEPVSFVVNNVDECTNVDDSLWDGNEVPVVTDNQACAVGDPPDTLPKLWEYAYTIGPYTDFCGGTDFTNTAYTLEGETSDSTGVQWTVAVSADCELDCVLGFGYWKNHSSYGHASYRDVNWDEVGGEDTPFFSSGQTYHDVLLTPPKQGNAYYILAHQYIPAELNIASGAAAPSDVQDAFDDATTLFSTYTPTEVEGFKGKTGKEIRDMFIAAATVLEQFNTGFCADNPGVDGCPDDTSDYPDACTEDASSASVAKASDSGESEAVNDLEAIDAETLPTEYALDANYPNPFNPSTTITFQLPESSLVRLSVFNVQGQEVEVLVDGTRPAGTHRVEFDAKGLPSGLYLYRLEASGRQFRKTMMLLK